VLRVEPGFEKLFEVLAEYFGGDNLQSLIETSRVHLTLFCTNFVDNGCLKL
jgi:hypothetical protein